MYSKGRVLILVLVDFTTWQIAKMHDWYCLIHVLILVLVDFTTWHNDNSYVEITAGFVLILVLVDFTTWPKKAWFCPMKTDTWS